MAKQPRILVGQVALVTGGARGIGKATARALVREGVKVAIGDLDLEAAQTTAQELGGGTVALALNVTDRASFDRFVADAEAALGPVDVLVNNAGIMQLGPFVEEDDATTQRMVDINVHGVLHGMKAVLPGFVGPRPGPPRQRRLDGRQGRLRGRGDLLRDEALRRRRQRGRAGGGARDRRRGLCVMPVVVQTELAAGLPRTRGVKQVTPEDVADEIVSALKVPRFDVFVPRSVGALNQAIGVLPRSGRELMARALKADRVLSDFDRGARAGYELRAARSEPGLEPGGDQRQLSEQTP